MEERKMILKMIEDGKVSAEEGLKLLEAVGKDEQEIPTSQSVSSKAREEGTDREESPFTKFTSFFESAFQKVRDGDFDFNFGNGMDIQHTFEEDHVDLNKVKVSLENGSFTIVPWEKEGVRLELDAKVYRTNNAEQAHDFLLKESSFSVEEGVLLFETKSKTMKVNGTLYVPTSTYDSIKLYTFNGSLTGESLKTKEFEANTTNGSIKTSHLQASKATIETMNGSITIDENTIGSLFAKTFNGTIKVTGKIEDADVETVNGSITYYVNKNNESAGYLDVKTTTGSVKLFVADDVRFEGKLRSNVGSIHNHLESSEIHDEKKELAQRYMHVTANDTLPGKMKVRAVANTGSITLRNQ
ncbi:DUF4097 family beta strand repeat-containing protein [Shouchella lehensis]|uniref:DUF4097 domain-containing protein n=1 Tax=Shouchella lehensis TaxID=300825 RepID=A0A4Y7WST4_9BACI|nr:DUF4097 domain-containing protein [Shouchella lehensis]MBG9783703.1 hypothetical protein [Shouchella lehensis]RQW21312.1 DUF4097 domain-containing protein [Bacillus sp. C1-1]TES51344.1 DUF4097 domain-containing protein [Shouchella lehensis]